MHLNSAQIEQASIIWVLVANEEHAQVYRYHKNQKIMPMHDSKRHPYNQMIKNHDLTPVPGLSFQAESLSDFESRRDERGSLIAVQYSGQNTNEPFEDVCYEIAENLVTKVASKLNHYCKTKAFDNLVIVAPLKIMDAFKQQLDPEVLRDVIVEIKQEYTQDKSHALLAQLQKSFAGTNIG